MVACLLPNRPHSSVTSVPRRRGRGDENTMGHDTPGERRIGLHPPATSALGCASATRIPWYCRS